MSQNDAPTARNPDAPAGPEPDFPRWIDMPHHAHEYGTLTCAQGGAPLPFEPRRVYWVADVPEGARRGGHAHRRGGEVIVAARGACTLTFYAADGSCQVFRLDDPRRGAYLPPHWWVELDEYDAGTLTIVISSVPYEERNYIRDPHEFFLTRPLPDPVSRARA